MKSMLNPFTPEISPLILLTICHKNLYNVSFENLVLDQLKCPYIYFFDIALTMSREILSWSLMEVKGLLLYDSVGLKKLIYQSQKNQN